MRDAGRGASFGIEQQQRKALGPLRHAGPGGRDRIRKFGIYVGSWASTASLGT
jgi:hypothetical protein